MKKLIILVFIFQIALGYSFKLFDEGGLFEETGSRMVNWSGAHKATFVYWYWTLCIRVQLMLDVVIAIAITRITTASQKQVAIPLFVILTSRVVDVFQFLIYRDVTDNTLLEISINLALLLTILYSVDFIDVRKANGVYVVRIPLLSRRGTNTTIEELINDNFQMQEAANKVTDELDKKLGPEAAKIWLIMTEIANEPDAGNREILLRTQGVKSIGRIGKSGKHIRNTLNQ